MDSKLKKGGKYDMSLTGYAFLPLDIYEKLCLYLLDHEYDIAIEENDFGILRDVFIRCHLRLPENKS